MDEALDDRGRKDTLPLAVFAEIIAGGAQLLGERDVPAVVYTTSKPDGDSSTVQHEVEVYIHSPGYVQDWIENLPQQHFTDSQGLQWTIATQGNIVIFAPSDFRDLTN